MLSNRLKFLGKVTAIDRDKIVIAGAVRTTMVALALVIAAWALGAPQNAIPLGVSALLVGLAEAGLPAGHRWRIMLWTTTWLMVTGLIGYLVAPNIFLTILASSCVALVAGWMGVAGPRAALIGTLSLVIFTITAGLPEIIKLSLDFVALMGLAGLVQTLVLALTALINNPKLLSVPPVPMETLWFRLTHPGEQRERYTRHALRLALAIAVATTISEYYSVPHQYWIPMTVAWIAKPDSTGTKVRIAQRVGGTALAVCIMMSWGIWLPKPEWALLVVIGVGGLVAFTFIWANYAVAVFGITLYMMSLFAQGGDLLERSVYFRLVATIAAALIVLTSLVIIRERKRLAT